MSSLDSLFAVGDIWAGQEAAATIGEVSAPVTSVRPVAGLPGAYDVRIQVPAGAPFGQEVPVRLRTTDGGISRDSNAATLAVEIPRP